MTTFETPEPISVTLDLGVADIRIAAGERVDTIVEVQPRDAANEGDAAAAQQARVEFANGHLLIRSPKGWRQWTRWGGHESIDVRIELPSGSSVRGATGVGALRSTGRIGECRFQTGVGDIVLEDSGSVELKAGMGDVTVEVIGGEADIKTAGEVRIGRIDGSARIRNSNGDTWVGEVGGDARVTAANGAISVDMARSSVAAKTANGDVRVREAPRGPVVAQSAFGALEIGVPDGVPAWLDLETSFGNVRNELVDAERPAIGEDTVEIRARTSMGDVTIRRAVASSAGTRKS
jgi:Putative adhesin